MRLRNGMKTQPPNENNHLTAVLDGKPVSKEIYSFLICG